jgi:hypothetical protein
MATLVARSRLAALGAETPLEPGSATGVDGPFNWRIDVAPQAAPASAVGQLLRVHVTVSDHSGAARAQITTLRLVQGG